MIKKFEAVAAVTALGLGLAGCSTSNASTTPVRVIGCNQGGGENMRLIATNSSNAPQSYDIQLYWFLSNGTQADGVQMQTNAVEPGKPLTFGVNGRVPSAQPGGTCSVKVLGTN